MSKFWVAGEQLVTQKGHLESNNAGGLMSGVGLDKYVYQMQKMEARYGREKSEERKLKHITYYEAKYIRAGASKNQHFQSFHDFTDFAQFSQNQCFLDLTVTAHISVIFQQIILTLANNPKVISTNFHFKSISTL